MFDEPRNALKSRMNKWMFCTFSYLLKKKRKKRNFSLKREICFILASSFLSSRSSEKGTFTKPPSKSWEIDENESRDREFPERERRKRIRNRQRRSIQKSMKANSKAPFYAGNFLFDQLQRRWNWMAVLWPCAEKSLRNFEILWIQLKVDSIRMLDLRCSALTRLRAQISKV